MTNHVGMGSRQQCFDGALVMICNISSVVTSSNANSWQQDLSVIVGGCEFAVVRRMPLILDWKKLAKSSAV